jgi:hypothetical protein
MICITVALAPPVPPPPRDMKEPGSLHQPGLCFMPPEPTADFCPCPAVPNPMRRRCGTGQTANWTRHVRSWCDLHSPLPANALPEGSQRVGMDPRDQARSLPGTDGTISWASRQCRDSTGISQNGVSGVLLWDPVFAPLLVLPFNHSSCICVSQDSGW